MAIFYGSKGAAVAALQTQLSRAGFLTGGTDGIYDTNTENAVQRAYAALRVPGQSGAASDELLGALQARAGSGGSVIGSTPPGGPTPVTELPSNGPSMAVKVGLGVAGLAILAGAFFPSKK